MRGPPIKWVYSYQWRGTRNGTVFTYTKGNGTKPGTGGISNCNWALRTYDVEMA